MTISRAVKLRTLFQLALPKAQSFQIWYQMKDLDIIFPGILAKYSKSLRKQALLLSAKTNFFFKLSDFKTK